MGSLRRGGANDEKKGGVGEGLSRRGGPNLVCNLIFFNLKGWFFYSSQGFSGLLGACGDFSGASRLFSCLLGGFGAFSVVLGSSRLFSHLSAVNWALCLRFGFVSFSGVLACGGLLWGLLVISRSCQVFSGVVGASRGLSGVLGFLAPSRA